MSLLALLSQDARRTLALAVLAGMAGGAGSVGLIALIHEGLSRDDTPVPVLAWGFAGLCLVALVSKVASQALLVRLAQGAVFQLHARLSRQVLAAPLKTVEGIGPHRLLASLTDDVNVIAAALVGLPALCINLVVVLCCLAYLGWLAPAALPAVLLFLAVGVASYQLVVGRALRHLQAARGDHDALMKHFRGLTDGTKELKIHRDRREAFLADVLLATAASYRRRAADGMYLYAAAGSWGQLLFLVLIGLLLFAPPGLAGVPRVALGGAALAILYAAAPLESVMSWIPALGRARVALRKVEALGLSLAAREDLGLGFDSTSSLPGHRRPATWGPLERLDLVGVTHAHRPDGEPGGFLLGPVDLTLRPGELAFLTGGNGSGKTTLAKVLTGLYAPESGEVRVNGRPVGPGEREDYRQLFSVVFADFYLFDGLLGLGAPGLDEQARNYLVLFGLAHKVRVKNGVFSTTALSQGQRKRLALLTAYLEDRPVYVFDEWAADQDPSFREVFYTRLLSELKARGKAVLVITHDERYFRVADRLVRLDDGKLARGVQVHDGVACV